jgi:hypothetical protein
MDRQIPSSAFLNIGQKLITVEPKIIIIRKPLAVNVIDYDVSVYDILREWASLLVDYFGDFM